MILRKMGSSSKCVNFHFFRNNAIKLFAFPSQSFLLLSSAEFYICGYMNRSFTQIILLGCIIIKLAALSSCANIIPPGGGPRDSLPPRLIGAFPKDSAINVTAKNITLTFDEYVTLQGVQENLIVSPTLKNIPLVDYKLRNVTIKIKDSLEPNTTYSLDFGESIRDVNEGNIARGITYVFSTGNTIDYNTYSGKVLLAESGKTDSSLIVVLYKNLSDTAIAKLSPRYYTRINGKGEFMFHNLPPGNFAAYVVPGINNYRRRYDDSTQLFAFRNGPITIQTNTPHDTFFAYQEFKRIEKSVNNSSVKLLPGKEDKRLRYSIELDNGQQDILNNLNLTFTRKLAGFDSTGFTLYDTGYHKLFGYSFSLDTSKTKVMMKYKWKEATPFRLLIAKDAVSDSAGITLAKADTLRFFTKKESDYGSLRLRFTNLDLSKNPVLQFVQNDKLVESVPITDLLFTRKLFRPGAYELRILFDTNKNGTWDAGQFFGTKRQPEIVQLIPKQLNIKPNWDNEVTISL